MYVSYIGDYSVSGTDLQHAPKQLWFTAPAVSYVGLELTYNG